MPQPHLTSINIDKIAEIASFARQIEGKAGPIEEPEDEAGDSPRAPMVEYPGDPTQERLRQLVDGLAPDERTELYALVLVGRGDYEAEEWSDAVAAADEIPDGPERTDRIIGRQLLAEELETALEQLGYEEPTDEA